MDAPFIGWLLGRDRFGVLQRTTDNLIDHPQAPGVVSRRNGMWNSKSVRAVWIVVNQT